MKKKQPALTNRPPLTYEEIEAMTFDELSQTKFTEDEFETLREVNKAREKRRLSRVAELKLESAPIRDELRSVGINIDSIDDLIGRSDQFAASIPVLLKHLQRPYSDPIRNSIARSLAVPVSNVRAAWKLLVEEYCKAPTGLGQLTQSDVKEYRLGAKEGLACALSVVVTDETLPELIALAKDRQHGESRVLLLSALKKRRKKNPIAEQAIRELATDPDLEKEIAAWR
jgi:hypothetical protein